MDQKCGAGFVVPAALLPCLIGVSCVSLSRSHPPPLHPPPLKTQTRENRYNTADDDNFTQVGMFYRQARPCPPLSLLRSPYLCIYTYTCVYVPAPACLLPASTLHPPNQEGSHSFSHTPHPPINHNHNQTQSTSGPGRGGPRAADVQYRGAHGGGAALHPAARHRQLCQGTLLTLLRKTNR